MRWSLQTMLRAQLSEINHRGLIHVAQYSPAEVFSMVETGEPGIELHGFAVGLGSQRYQVFARSCTCVTCGLEGTVMCLDRNKYKKRQTSSKRAHFNLYGITRSGRVVMLTKDHIVPKSKGGANTLDNYQTMCDDCNNRKGAACSR